MEPTRPTHRRSLGEIAVLVLLGVLLVIPLGIAFGVALVGTLFDDFNKREL